MISDVELMNVAVETIQRSQRGEAVGRAALATAVDDVVAVTSRAYSREARRYQSTRETASWSEDEVFTRLLLQRVRDQIDSGNLPLGSDGRWSLLDVGAGYGRDVLRLAEESDIVVSALENSANFIGTLRELEAAGRLNGGRVFKADMRNLGDILDGTFQCVRNHATLHHLPVVGAKLGADAAVAESHRVLMPGGIFYVTVKTGAGVDVIDTAEGLGGRFFQLFDEESLSGLMERNHFRVVEMRRAVESRSSGPVGWLLSLSVAG